MSTDERVYLVSGPIEATPPGYDGTVWRWFVGRNEVLVKVSATAMEAGGSERCERAIETQGQSEIETFLDWYEPPDEIEFSTSNWPWTIGGERDGDPE